MKYLNRKISTMAGKPIPNPSILDRCKVVGVEGQRKVYYDSQEERYYTWDSLHGELEVFNEFLGMSWEEYSLWAVKPSLLAEILNHRKQDVSSKKLVLPTV